MGFLGINPDLSWWQAAFAGLAASASLIAAIAAGWALLYFRGQHRTASTAVGFDCLWKLTESWDSDRMRECRVRAATVLSQSTSDFTQDVLDIVNTFENVGYLVVAAKVLTVDHAWGQFSSYAGPYWCATQVHLLAQQSTDPTLWEYYERLVTEFDKIERRKRGLGKDAPLPYRTATEVAGFLGDEKGILEDRIMAPLSSPAQPSTGECTACRCAPYFGLGACIGGFLVPVALRCLISRKRNTNRPKDSHDPGVLARW